jgi:hypothetical protein
VIDRCAEEETTSAAESRVFEVQADIDKRTEPVSKSYEGPIPVFQWDISPDHPEFEDGEVHVELGDWEFRIWWQEHPAGLVYVSIQALDEDDVDTGQERPHPMGRNVVVNLVYDHRRRGITAIYGTAIDFRPFVEAFRAGYGPANVEHGAGLSDSGDESQR